MPDIWAAIRDNWAAYFTIFLVAALGATYFGVVRPRRRRRSVSRSRPRATRRPTATRARRTGGRPQRRPRRRK